MRILLGVTEIGGLIPVMADALRQLGHQVTTVVRQKNNWWPVEYDVDFTGRAMTLTDVAEIGYLIGAHDVIMFQWGRTTFLPDYSDIPFIKAKGKKIISGFVGSDVRDTNAYKQWYQDARHHLDALPFPDDALVNSLYPLRMAELHSDVIISHPNASVLAVRPYMHFFLPMELNKYRSRIPARDIPVIVHAPSRKWLKGTSIVLDALKQLEQEGVAFELRLLENVPNQAVVEELVNADVLIDQLFFPQHGKLSLEGLACGCAVVNGDREDYEPFPAGRPFWHISPENIVDRLRILLTNKTQRTMLALEGAPYLKQYHDHVRVMERVLAALDPKFTAFDHYPTFFAQRYQLPPGEVIPEPLLHATSQLLTRWGLPKGVVLSDLKKRMLIA